MRLSYIIGLAIIALQGAKCEFVFKPVGDTAYYIEIGSSEQRIFDWFDARESCWQNNGELVSIVSPDQLVRLQSFIVSEGYANGSTFGTSGHSYDIESRFKWEALGESVQYTKWLPGEEPPADCNLSLQLIDSELYMIRSWGYDEYFICEYSPPMNRLLKSIHKQKYQILFLIVIFAAFLVFISSTQRNRKPILQDPSISESKRFLV